VLPPAPPEPSRRLSASTKYETCRLVEHRSTPERKRPDAPDTQLARLSKTRAVQPIGNGRNPPATTEAIWTVMRTPEGALPSTRSALPEPSVLPPRAPSSPRSCGLAPHRLASYRLDALGSPIGCPTGAPPSATWCFHHLPTGATARPRQLRLEPHPRRCRRGSEPADPTAAEPEVAPEQPQTVELLEPWALPPRNDAMFTHDDDLVRRTPRGLLHGGRCGSATEVFGAIVDARRHDGVATATTRPACITAQRGNRSRSTRTRLAFLGSPRQSFATPDGHGEPQPPIAPQIADLTNRLPTEHRP
jgi:hypothetical protein